MRRYDARFMSWWRDELLPPGDLVFAGCLEGLAFSPIGKRPLIV